MELTSNPAVTELLKAYPIEAQKGLNKLRDLILKTAKDLNIAQLEETLKWGEPSYLAKKGSTIRIDWKSKKPDQYAIYFKCTSKLVNTFKQIHGETFNYETTRAIVFKFDDVIPEEELSQCIGMALRYHQVKTLPLLGADISD